MKILYFEGAGMSFYSSEQTDHSDVGNFRIRTAFKNDEGVGYYLELGRTPRYDFSKSKPKKITDFALHVDHVFKLEDRNKEELSMGGYEMRPKHKDISKLDYTKKDITKWVNENLNCSFDTIQVLDRYYNYCVHADYNGKEHRYNLMEDHKINHKQAQARREAHDKIIKKYAKIFNRKHPAISIREMVDNYIVFDNHQGEELLQKYGLPSRYEKILIKF